MTRRNNPGVCPGRPVQDLVSGLSSPSPGWALGSTAMEPHHISPLWARAESDSWTQGPSGTRCPHPPESRRSQTSAHQRLSLQRGCAELFPGSGGKEGWLGMPSESRPSSAGDASTLLLRCLKTRHARARAKPGPCTLRVKRAKEAGTGSELAGENLSRCARARVCICIFA